METSFWVVLYAATDFMCCNWICGGETVYEQNPVWDNQEPTGPGTVYTLLSPMPSNNRLLCARTCTRDTECSLFSYDIGSGNCLGYKGDTQGLVFTPNSDMTSHSRLGPVQIPLGMILSGSYGLVVIGEGTGDNYVLEENSTSWKPFQANLVHRIGHKVGYHPSSGKLIVAGGFLGPTPSNDDLALDSVEVYTKGSGFQPSAQTMDVGRAFGAVAVYEDEFWFCLGMDKWFEWDTGNTGRTCSIMNIVSEVWRAGPSLPTGSHPSNFINLHQPAFALVGHQFYIAGGQGDVGGNQGFPMQKWAYRVEMNATSPAWTQLPDLKRNWAFHAGTVFDNEFYFCGGFYDNSPNNQRCAKWDEASGDFIERPIGDMDSQKRNRFGLVVFGGKMIAIGGNNGAGREDPPRNLPTYEYDQGQNKWILSNIDPLDLLDFNPVLVSHYHF